jgi:hypothetical protein
LKSEKISFGNQIGECPDLFRFAFGERDQVQIGGEKFGGGAKSFEFFARFGIRKIMYPFTPQTRRVAQTFGTAERRKFGLLAFFIKASAFCPKHKKRRRRQPVR